MSAQRQASCPGCGKAVDYHTGGRPQTYCGLSCRQAERRGRGQDATICRSTGCTQPTSTGSIWCPRHTVPVSHRPASLERRSREFELARDIVAWDRFAAVGGFVALTGTGRARASEAASNIAVVPVAFADDVPKVDPRVDEMNSLRLQGLTLQQIGERFGLTRERVRQLTTVSSDEVRRLKRAEKEKTLLAGACSACGVDGVHINKMFCDVCDEKRKHHNGTRYNSGCRCDDCRASHAERASRLRVRRHAALEAKQIEVEHGKASTYNNWGCRCDPCTTAHSKYCQPYVDAWVERQKQRRAAPNNHPDG